MFLTEIYIVWQLLKEIIPNLLIDKHIVKPHNLYDCIVILMFSSIVKLRFYYELFVSVLILPDFIMIIIRHLSLRII